MKDWWKSKTIWINVIAIGAIIVKSELGLSLDPEYEVLVIGGLLAVINLVLRKVTKEEIVWKK